MARKLIFIQLGACASNAGGYDGPLLKMSEREIILLDASVDSVIEPHAFRAVLGNGHRFTAYVAAWDRERKSPEAGDSVRVEKSPGFSLMQRAGSKAAYSRKKLGMLIR